MADQYLFELSQESQMTTEPFVSRQVVYVIDQNNGAYNGQIQLDTSALSNSGKYASYSEAYFEVPLVMRLTATSANAQVAAVRNLDCSFAAGLKNGYHQLIHSISVEYNNTSVVQLTPYTNFYISYKLMTSLSQDDLKKYGSFIGFFPDSTSSVYFGSQVAADVQGHGSVNNRDLAQLPASLATWNAISETEPNVGFFTRQKTNTAFTTTAGFVSASFTNNSNMNQVGYNYFVRGSAGNDVDSKWWNVIATIRLKDIADLFQKMPLVKGAFLRFIINTNTATHNLSLVVAGGALTDVSVTSSIIQNGSSPMLLASTEAGNGLAPLVDALIAEGNDTYTFQLACSIARDTAYPTYQHPTLQNVRLYVPLYTFQPVAEEQYLTLNKTKMIKYTDIYQYQTDVACSSGSGSFNVLLTNGVSQPTAVIIMPMFSTSANAVNSAGTVKLAPFQSPFASEPATTSPYIALTSFNIQVSGVNLFVQNENYDFEAFKNELAGVNAINGGLMDGITSGLIGYNEFETNYRYYVGDVARRLPAEVAPKSIQILGTVLTGASISSVTLYVFIEFSKTINIDLETGALL